MRPATTILVILVVSYVVAFVITPPDPFSCLLVAAAIFMVATVSYVVGRLEPRTSAAAPQNGRRRRAENAD